ncbi:uncharacterized protein STEHIDRAFT_49041 [Stereum hirsutum FP-91666 SS1]|uniref:uncharacterized protein n=1 Tax=Stereum hirsutum (strain FP-91666) TaxID=721885 RepID=UPI000440BF97|nr:uncharacterized protein STEHIDRAFT_49041 [Stereum hirsutum FP-91666 SS1]EIM91012.1 hypothetical protein STEHIDRAFT_49041 [Stereum hirsutum FP-91666 SS1]
MPLHVNAHPGYYHEETEHSVIPHPPDEEQKSGHEDFPDTGWRGQPPTPSQDGGDSEKDFMHKPPYLWKSDGDKFEKHYTSQCWCGDVVFEFHGNPLDAKHCHCHQCQSLHGAPFQWAVIFPKTSIRLVKNEEDHLHFFSTEKRTSGHDVPCKVSCDNCRSPLFDEGKNTVLAYPGSFRFKDRHVPHDFQPTAHIFYEQRVMEVPDGMCVDPHSYVSRSA